MDDNFSSIVKAVTWGRSVFDNIRKFLQFQLTVNLVALTLTFLSAIRGQSPPLNAVMMLWVNLIMDTMGALALGTEPPSPTLLLRRPYKRNASLISNTMIRNILVQYAFQIALLSYLFYYGAVDFDIISSSDTSTTQPESNSFASFFVKLFSKSSSPAIAVSTAPVLSQAQSVVLNTIIFNTFVFCQLFNEMNSRSIANDMNIFSKLFQNSIFMVIIVATVVVQIFIVELGQDFVRTASLTAEQWVSLHR